MFGYSCLIYSHSENKIYWKKLVDTFWWNKLNNEQQMNNNTNYIFQGILGIVVQKRLFFLLCLQSIFFHLSVFICRIYQHILDKNVLLVAKPLCHNVQQVFVLLFMKVKCCLIKAELACSMSGFSSLFKSRFVIFVFYSFIFDVFFFFLLNNCHTQSLYFSF